MGALGLGVLMALSAPPARAQSAEELYQKANDAYNVAKFEEACELLTKLSQVSPGYKDSDRMRNESCSTAQSQRKAEDTFFKKGVDLYNQGKFDDAKSAFEKAKAIPLFHPAHKAEISQYLQQIETQAGSEKAFQTGVNLFSHGKYADARNYFTQVAQGSGPRAAEARSYLNRITTELAKANKPPAEQPPAHVQNQPPPRVIQPAGTKPAGDAAEPTLRAGLQSYFEGNFVEAEKSLTEYLANNGHRKGLAYFFRGASYGTEYYLSGEKDSKQRDHAVADFRSVKDKDPSFHLPDKQYVAPKILALYNDALAAGN